MRPNEASREANDCTAWLPAKPHRLTTGPYELRPLTTNDLRNVYLNQLIRCWLALTESDTPQSERRKLIKSCCCDGVRRLNCATEPFDSEPWLACASIAWIRLFVRPSCMK